MVVVDKIKSYFNNLTDEEIEKIYNSFMDTNKDINYLEEKLILTKNTDCKTVVGFLIKAIKEDYKPHKNNVMEFKPKYKVGAGAGVNETFRNYTAEQLEELAMQKRFNK